MNLIKRSCKCFVINKKIYGIGLITGATEKTSIVDEPRFNSKNHSMEIDSLRGIAILLVFLYHVRGVLMSSNMQIPQNGTGLLLSFIYTGATGVTLFFVLSSFLLSIPFYMKPDISRKKFYTKRLLRILPLFYIIVTIAGIATATGWNHPTEVIRSYLFFFDGWKLFPFSVPWWSLRTEVEFYILLGILMPFIHYHRKGRIILIFSFAGIAVSRYLIFKNIDFFSNFMHMYPLLATILSQSVISHAPTFFIGIMTSIVYLKYGFKLNQYFSRNKILKNGGADIFFLSVICLLSIVLFKVANEGGIMGTEYSWPQHYTYEAFLWSLILLSVIVLPLKLKNLISNRYLAKLGEISYSFYLIHLPVIVYANKLIFYAGTGENIRFFGRIIFVFIMALILSYLSYTYIERPFLQIKDRIK